MTTNNEYHLLRIKNALAILEESLRALMQESTFIEPAKRTRLRETDEFYNIKELPRVVGLGRSSIYSMMGENRFPLPIRLGKRRIAWRKKDIHKWLDKKK